MKAFARSALIVGVFAVLVGGVAPSAASAAEPEEKIEISCGSIREVGEELLITIPQFDPTKGTLNSVTLRSEFSGFITYANENISDSPWPSGFTYGPIVNDVKISSFFGDLLELSNSQMFVADEHPEVTAFDGIDDGLGSSSWHFNPVEGPPISTTTSVDSTRLSEFVGQGETLLLSGDAGHIYGEASDETANGDATLVSTRISVNEDLTSMLTVCASYAYLAQGAVDPNPIGTGAGAQNGSSQASAQPAPTLAESGGEPLWLLSALGSALVLSAGLIAVAARMRRREPHDIQKR